MGPETMLELDPRPLPARRGRQPAPPLLLHMMRGFLWVAASASLAGSLLLALVFWLRQGAPAATVGQVGWAFVVGFMLMAVAAAAATRLGDAGLPRALTGLLSLLVLGGVAASVLLGRAVVVPGMPFSALLVCVLCVVAGWRAGAVLAVVAAAAALGLAFLSQPAPGLGLQLGLHLIAIAAGVGCGVLISRVLGRFMRNAEEREQRFTRLLALAADGYWEIDHQYRLQAAGSQASRERALTPERGLGRMPWDLPQFSCDAEMLDALIADLDTRVPFRDLPVRWTSSDGKVRSLMLSGEPRFDDRGVFTGYWGVARDETVVHRVHAALAATETRYQELFSHIPTPLVLHRGGRVLDANPAALQLFGHAQLQSMLGSDILAAFESGDSRERARRRMETLHGQSSGTALPVGDFRLAIGGRQISVRGTAVNVDAEGGPAMLAIFVDDTERLLAEESVRRSEALLSHLFATSPDLITLTEMSSGRYAMVNRSFEQLTGYSAAETVGRTAQELGIWGNDNQAHDLFMAELHDRGLANDLRVTFTSKDGKPVRLLLSAARFVMDRREYMVINARDISERERQRLEREAILDNASVGIAVARRRQLVLTNRHFEQIYGWAPGELPGQSSTVLWADAADDETLDLQSRAAAGGSQAVQPVELERRAKRKDGSSFTARIRARAIDPNRPDEGTIWIVEDVTERREFEQTLARARDDAEAASRAKSAFLANTSHELRTPLNAMIGLARLAQDEHVVPERRREYLDQIATSAQSLAAIISDILDLSKIESGKLQVEKTHFDLGAELHALQRNYTTLAAAHGLELRVELAPDVSGIVSGDPLRVRQIVSNFLANAIKFTATGYVALKATRLQRERADVVRLEVRDSGPGLDAATSARLFKPFTQGDQSTTRRFGGTGLGLSICHELATLMGGLVGVNSFPGDGSTFWAELPLPRVSPDAALLPPDITAALPTGSLANCRVLMVEDNAVNMMIAVALLERWGVHVGQAHDGLDAVAAVQRAAVGGHPYDAVLMDVQMPVMSGHEATRALREAGYRLPIIALTAAALVSEREAALQAGMNDFLTKPIDAHKLQATLLRWCGCDQASLAQAPASAGNEDTTRPASGPVGEAAKPDQLREAGSQV